MTSIKVEVMSIFTAPAHKVVYLVVIDTFQRDAINLYFEARSGRSVDTFHNLVEFSPSGDGGKFFRIQCIK